MKPIKFILLGTSIVALIALFFMPYFNLGEGASFTLWKINSLGAGETIIHPYGVLIAAGITAAIAGLAISRGRLPRGLAIVTALCSIGGALLAWSVFSKAGTSFGEVSAFGAKVMLAAFVVAAVASFAGLKGERA